MSTLFASFLRLPLSIFVYTSAGFSLYKAEKRASPPKGDKRGMRGSTRETQRKREQCDTSTKFVPRYLLRRIEQPPPRYEKLWHTTVWGPKSCCSRYKAPVRRKTNRAWRPPELHARNKSKSFNKEHPGAKTRKRQKTRKKRDQNKRKTPVVE